MFLVFKTIFTIFQMSAVLRGCYDDQIEQVTVIDCRYPYEYDGGHIQVSFEIPYKKNLQKIM